MIQLYIAFDLGFDIVENLIPNVFSVLTQLVSTGVLLYVFVKLVYKPVINWLDGRAQAMQEDLSVAQAQREDAQLLKEKAQEIFVSADHKAYEIVEKGRQEAIKQKDEILASYAQLFQEGKATGQAEELIAKNLGKPKDIATEILSSFNIRY